MKRLQLFEFEDFYWFPSGLRNCLTRYLQMIHRLLDSAPNIAKLLDDILKNYRHRHIIDLCSGSGGPMLEVVELLKSEYGYPDATLTLTDLHPNRQALNSLQDRKDPSMKYHPDSVDATNINIDMAGVRTLVCGLHHMNPSMALAVLKRAQDTAQPILIYEISDNSYHKWLWWLVIPVNIVAVLLLTPMVRPMSWQQLVFTYLIPVLPLVIAWDGAVSNARTYTLEDLDILLQQIPSEKYGWTKGSIPGKGGPKLYLWGGPKTNGFTLAV